MSPLILALLGGFARTAVPAATAYLAGFGIALPGGMPDIMLVALAAVAWLGMQLWSIARKRFTLPETIGSLARVFLPTVTAFSAGQGVVGDAGSMQSILLSGVVAAAMVAWSWARKTARAKISGAPSA